MPCAYVSRIAVVVGWARPLLGQHALSPYARCRRRPSYAAEANPLFTSICAVIDALPLYASSAYEFVVVCFVFGVFSHGASLAYVFWLCVSLLGNCICERLL